MKNRFEATMGIAVMSSLHNFLIEYLKTRALKQANHRKLALALEAREPYHG